MKIDMKRHRIIGTTPEAIRREEQALGRKLPPSFVAWLLENNGLAIGDVDIYPVKDDGDVRKTWDSLAHNFTHGWADWVANFADETHETHDFGSLLPFANYGTGDYYCFDYTQAQGDGECPVVRWSHETGKTEFRAPTFADFVNKVRSSDFAQD